MSRRKIRRAGCIGRGSVLLQKPQKKKTEGHHKKCFATVRGKGEQIEIIILSRCCKIEQTVDIIYRNLKDSNGKAQFTFIFPFPETITYLT